ncbi:MAG: winged helix-turn-helix transcriptional regulator [Spirochaetales bacterium]|nr:winged helix-turn-helix transcriptional regulator [Spirochaetales bacterium]
MPLHQTASYDPLTAMTQIRTSQVFEMLISLQGIVDSWKMQDLAEETKNALGDEFLTETTTLYRRLFICCIFAELAVDYPERDNVIGFIEYVRSLPLNELLFYLLGRWFPRESIPPDFNRELVEKLIEEHAEASEFRQMYPELTWIDDLASIRDNICRMWERYWNGFYRDKVADLRELLIRSMNEKQDYLEQHGGTALYREITGHDELPRPVPADMPITRIELIPLCHTPRNVYIFYGYGSAQVLYDCSMTEDRQRKADDYRTKSLAALKALADENRLKILKMISQNERLINGKRIAQKLDVSPSVVSRHLSQLKDAGLIEEFSTDKRNITYSFQISRLRALGQDIEAYIRA